jgi:hypothetical protein
MPGQDCQNTAAITVLSAQDYLDRTVSIRQPGQDGQKKKARIGQLEHATRTGETEQDCTGRTGRSEKDTQDKTGQSHPLISVLYATIAAVWRQKLYMYTDSETLNA